MAAAVARVPGAGEELGDEVVLAAVEAVAALASTFWLAFVVSVALEPI